MSVKGKTLKFGVAAVVLAALIVAAVYVAAPNVLPSGKTTTSQASGSGTTQTGSSTYLVMLTDPPSVPAGTAWLNVTYAGLTLDVTLHGGASQQVASSASGTIDLMDLVNVSQTLASVSVPTGSVVHSLQLTITSAKIDVNNTVYTIPSAASRLSVSVASSVAAPPGFSGAIVDLSPTVVPVTIIAQNGSASTGFVFVPSAVALGQAGASQSQAHVGAKIQLSSSVLGDLGRVRSSASANLTIASATVSVKGNVTDISIRLHNSGSSNATLFGLVLQGELNTSLTFTSHVCPVVAEFACVSGSISLVHQGAIPFDANAASDALVPLFGEGSASGSLSPVVIAAGQSATLNFSGTISLALSGTGQAATFVVSPVVEGSYTVLLMGDGVVTTSVQAA
jgi:hypothetical protein